MGFAMETLGPLWAEGLAGVLDDMECRGARWEPMGEEGVIVELADGRRYRLWRERVQNGTRETFSEKM